MRVLKEFVAEAEPYARAWFLIKDQNSHLQQLVLLIVLVMVGIQTLGQVGYALLESPLVA